MALFHERISDVENRFSSKISIDQERLIAFISSMSLGENACVDFYFTATSPTGTGGDEQSGTLHTPEQMESFHSQLEEGLLASKSICLTSSARESSEPNQHYSTKLEHAVSSRDKESRSPSQQQHWQLTLNHHLKSPCGSFYVSHYLFVCPTNPRTSALHPSTCFYPAISTI
jgi:hypothetical protein